MQRSGLKYCLSNVKFQYINTHMKKLLIVFILGALVAVTNGCVKGSSLTPCTNKTPQSEQADMLAYAAAQGFNMSLHPNGMYYEVVNPGSGAIALETSRIFVRYTGRLISSNAIFDQQQNHTLTGWTLNTLIQGWQVGVPLIQVGGKIRLIVPSSLAYGCQPYSSLPGNAVLFFEIELVEIQ
jgi:FKBP-type peptidyl-prolyl cis-trans isomerase FkpA